MRRTFVTILIVLLAFLATAGPAAARSISGVPANNFETRLMSVSPGVPGIRVRVVEIGSRLELTNDTDTEVVVLGYSDEPYLRVGRNGVYENRRSPAVYINANRQGDTVIPGNADPEAQPDWRQISSGNVARWHDHRTHWMGNQDPAAVQRDPGSTHVVIPKWTVTARMGGEQIRISGDLRWVPAPSALPWLALAAVAFVAVMYLAFTSVGVRGLTVVLAALLVVDVVHAIGFGWTKAGGTGEKLGQISSGSVYSLVGWVITVVALVMLGRNRRAGLFAALAAGGLLALFGGVLDLADLTRSQIPFAWSPWVARLFVAISLGGGLGVLTAAAICIRRDTSQRRSRFRRPITAQAAPGS